MLNLMEKEANRAAYRSMNKIADEIKRDSARVIAHETGLSRESVTGRMYVKGASATRLLAVVGAMPSAKNVGYYPSASPVQRKPGVELKAWRQRTVYDRAFVKGPPRIAAGIPRKVWRRTGPGDDQITDKVWGPSVRKSFTRPFLQARQMALLQKRWPFWFQRYLRGELVKLGRGSALTGIANVLPTIVGPTITDDGR